jgi:hypothetical protein
MKFLQKILLSGFLGLSLISAGCDSIKPLREFNRLTPEEKRLAEMEKQRRFEEQRKRDTGYFACSSYFDANWNCKEELNEFTGIKERFRKGEQMLLVAYNFARRKQMEGLEILSPEGKIVYNIRIRLERDGQVLKVPINTERLAKKAGLGLDTAKWTMDEEQKAEKMIEIYE